MASLRKSTFVALILESGICRGFQVWTFIWRVLGAIRFRKRFSATTPGSSIRIASGLNTAFLLKRKSLLKRIAPKATLQIKVQILNPDKFLTPD